MSVEIRGIDEARAVFQSIDDFLGSKKPMQGFCDDVKQRILTKTATGQDYMSRRFKPYSKAYEKKKKQWKLVNLRVSGRMLDNISAQVISPEHGRVAVKRRAHGKITTDMLANIHSTGTGKQPQREFMNISQVGIKELVDKHYNEPLKKLAQATRTWKP